MLVMLQVKSLSISFHFYEVESSEFGDELHVTLLWRIGDIYVFFQVLEIHIEILKGLSDF